MMMMMMIYYYYKNQKKSKLDKTRPPLVSTLTIRINNTNRSSKILCSQATHLAGSRHSLKGLVPLTRIIRRDFQ